MSPHFHFLVPSLDVEFHVVRFSGTEGLGQLFRFTIVLVCKSDTIDMQDILDEAAVFSIRRENAEPVQFPGVVASIEQGGCFNDWYYYTVELRPNFWLLSQWTRSAIFLDKNVQNIAEEIFNENPRLFIAPQFRLLHSYPQREFVMQYEETPYDFILWNLEQAGIYYYFSEKGNSIIFADGPQSHDQASITVAYSPVSNLEGSKQGEVITSFSLKQESLPRQVIIRNYNWKKPSKIIVGKAEVFAKGRGDVFFTDEDVASEEEANKLAGLRAQEILCSQCRFLGKSAVPLFRPGVVFRLEKHFSKSFNRDYLITEIEHEGAQGDFLSLGLGIPVEGGYDQLSYRNSFSCIESNVVFRPRRQAKRAKITGFLHAFIDGAGSGARAEMDEFGRYKVLFPFDTSGRKDGKASCWIRKAQQQVGRDSGLSFPLLPGTEVLVGFINGNPDRPVITGALANGETGTISGCGNVNVSGIRTAGGNQITFNDTDTKQGIALHDARGHGITMTAGSSDQLNVTTDRKLEAAVVGSTEIASICKTAVSGFMNTSAVAASKNTAAFFAFIANSLCSSAKKTMDSLGDTNAATKATGEALSWASDVTKLIETIVLICTGGGGDQNYGFNASASEEQAQSTLQVKPKLSQLITYMVPYVMMTVASKGVEFAKNVRETKNTFASIKDVIKECMDELYKYNNTIYSELKEGASFYNSALQYSCAYYKSISDYLTSIIRNLTKEKTQEEDGYTTINNQILKMIENMYIKENKLELVRTAMKYLYDKDKKTYNKYNPDGIYYKEADKYINKRCDEVTSALNLFQGKKLEEKTKKVKKLDQDLDKFTELQNKLNKSYTANCLKQTDGTGYSGYDKSAAIRKVTTTTVSSWIAELVSIISLITWSVGISKKKTLGGISLSSEDSNINASAKKMVSLHSKDGIFLDTKTNTVEKLDNMVAWGIPTEEERAAEERAEEERAWNTKILEPVKNWELRSELDEKVGQNWKETKKKVKDFPKDQNTLVAIDTDISYLKAKWLLEKVDFDVHSEANNYSLSAGKTEFSLSKKAAELSSEGFITCESESDTTIASLKLNTFNDNATQQIVSLLRKNKTSGATSEITLSDTGALIESKAKDSNQQDATGKLLISPANVGVHFTNTASAVFTPTEFKFSSDKVEIGNMVVAGNTISSSAPGGVLDFGGCIKVTGANGSSLQIDSSFNDLIRQIQEDVKTLKGQKGKDEGK